MWDGSSSTCDTAGPSPPPGCTTLIPAVVRENNGAAMRPDCYAAVRCPARRLARSTDHAKGIAGVTHPGLGTYCVDAPGIDSAQVSAAATVENGGTAGFEGDTSAMIEASALDCPSGQFEVITERQPQIAVRNAADTGSVGVSGNAIVRRRLVVHDRDPVTGARSVQSQREHLAVSSESVEHGRPAVPTLPDPVDQEERLAAPRVARPRQARGSKPRRGGDPGAQARPRGRLKRGRAWRPKSRGQIARPERSLRQPRIAMLS